MPTPDMDREVAAKWQGTATNFDIDPLAIRARLYLLTALAVIAFLVPYAAIAQPNASSADARSADSAQCESLQPYTGQPIENLPESMFSDHDPVQVGTVRVHRLPVFDLNDPEQDNWLFRTANSVREALRLNTQEWVIRNELLFEENDLVEGRLIRETERLMRSKAYLYDARVLPAQRCGDRIDLDVISRDVWTMSPRIDVSRSGGESDLGVGFADINLFGTGKFLTLGYREDVDRAGVDASYVDPNIAGSFHRLALTYMDADDGFWRFADAGLPFYSLQSRWSWGVRAEQLDREDDLYFRGDEFAEFRNRADVASAFVGWSPGLDGNQQHRFFAGYAYENRQFDPLPGIPAPQPFPEDRKLAYPYLGWQLVEDDFHLTRNLDFIQRTEDLFLGRTISASLGYSATEDDRWVYRAEAADGFRIAKDNLIRVRVFANGQYLPGSDGGAENAQVGATMRYRGQQSPRFSLVAEASYTLTDGLTEDRQLLLGGDTGLRGYPLRYQFGDRAALFSLEERYFSDLYLLKTVRLGAAVFVDAGRAWSPSGPSEDEAGWLADVGIGLRFESTRTQSGAVLHMDLAFPLVDGEDVDSVQLILSLKESL